ncbi:MAG: class II aldolase/adducin family protein [Clostridiales bacterium]|nr:class II aldolase/adducin family protein [Clostridiales bacterium]
MAYELQEAKRIVVEAGKKLVETGLIARTWGNVSARISDTQFVITPSGRAYETLTPEEIVTVNIADCEYEGEIKPSSEKGIHADAYRLRPDVDFVIHTHQVKASVISPTGLTIRKVYPDLAQVLGDVIPSAEYGMPSTGKLRRGVEEAMEAYPDCKAFIMKHHGALCLGKDYDESFAVAEALEKACDRVIKENYMKRAWVDTFDETEMRNYYLNQAGSGMSMPDSIGDFGSSERAGDHFLLTIDGKTIEITVDGCVAVLGLAPKVAKVHAAIYRNSDVTHIKHMASPDAVAVSCTGQDIRPMLDDFAQIAGPTVKNVPWVEGDTDRCTDGIVKALKGRNAVFIQGPGALCTGSSQSDADAVELVMAKGCETEIGANLFMRPNRISPLECRLMRTIYVTQYSKKAAEK